MRCQTPRCAALPAAVPVVLVLALALAFSLVPRTAPAQGTPIGFAEQFALATDRARALELLIPGTEDYYYYHCLHRQNTGAFEGVGPLLQVWIERYGRGARVEEIENRQALLTFERDPAATFAVLRQRLGLRFDAERQSSGAMPDLPTRLDPELLSPARLTRRALERHPGTLDGFRDSAFEFLAASDLSPQLLMSLLRRLQRPDVPNLPALVARNLQNPESRGFGSLPIHQKLLLDQLEELVRLQPALLDENAFIAVHLARLQPGADVAWQRDRDARLRYLERLQAFVQRLAPAHNSLKAHVLHRRLALDLALGAPDKARFMSYLRLPRQTGYTNPNYLRRRARADELVDARKAFPTGLAPIGDDEPLVRAYLEHFFRSEDSFQPYAEFVRDEYLQRLFAETKILAGIGDMERWYSMLDDPGYYEQLKERVEIGFVPTQRTELATADPVGIDVDLKNVDKLLVKVFVIDTFDFERENGKEVDASIDLDGMVANEEQTHPYEDNPLRRVRRHFDFPSLQRAGTYVVEFLGNGLSSRAVIRKGRLSSVVRIGAAGQVFTVLDEDRQVVRDASIWCGGQEYAADGRGEVNIPFAPERREQTMVLRHGALTALEHFVHLEESYDLAAGIFVDREALLPRHRAKILVRPTLSMHGVPVDLSLLLAPELAITAVDQDGVASSLTVRDLKLEAGVETVHEIAVPDRLVRLTVALRGQVENLGKGEKVALASAPAEFTLNGIDATPQTDCPLLGRAAGGYVLDVLGKSGEPRPERVVTLAFEHEDFTDPIDVELKTDARGRIELGRLPGITAISASGLPAGAWRLREAACTYASTITGVAGTTLRVPYVGDRTRADRSAVSLLEVSAGAFVRDALDHVALAGGFVELRDLAPGDYDLWLKEAGQHVEVRVTEGVVRAGWAVGQDRMLELEGADPLQIESLAVAGEELQVRLANADAGTRVHVFATRYLAPFDPFDDLRPGAGPAARESEVRHPESSYHAGRTISDEYRYILERRYSRKFPGNMLHRPGLLLDPWALEETQSAVGLGGGEGGKFGGRAGGRRPGGPSSPGPKAPRAGLAPGAFPDLGFLPAPAPTLCNLRPDGTGLVRVPLADLGSGQLVHVLAAGDGGTVYRTLARPEQPLAPRSQALAGGLDPTRHFTEQKRIEFVTAGQTTVVDDVTTSSLESYGSLAAVLRLFQTLSGNADLDRFAFVLRWPELPPDEKRALYSTHACHELHFFLRAKDPEFFGGVVRPYLANKANKTFLDHWLLDDDLDRYLEPWAFGRLNIVEQILLTRRLEDARAAGARHVRELYDLAPPDPERQGHLFATALRGGALDAARPDADDFFKAPAEKNARRFQEDSEDEGRGRFRAQAPGAARDRKLAAKAEQMEEQEQEVAAAEPADKAGAVRRSLGEDLERRKQVRQLYRGPGLTLEYVEQNYWHLPIAEQNADLIRVNAFWRDFAAAPARAAFCSPHVAEAAGSFAEMMLALAVLDLPFQGREPARDRDGDRLTLTAETPLLLVRKELRPAEPAAAESPILISQDCYRLDDRYRFVGNERRDKFVTGEFLIDVAYGCQVVLTNPTSTPKKLDLLLQVPRGAVPVQNGFYTRGVSVQLDPFATASFDYAFYFPAPGDYPHYPAHVGRDGTLVAFAGPATLHVVAMPSEVDTSSWEHVSQDGTAEEVIAYLDANNLDRIDLGRIAWRMRDRAFFDAVIARLRRRLHYAETLWSWGLLHGDEATSREYLTHAEDFVGRCGRALVSRLLTIDPIERHAYQHIEFDPLFHARTHRFGRQRRILNGDLAAQYGALLDILCYGPRLDDAAWLSVTYYLLLQDRIEDALTTFQRVDAARLPTRLQHDYMRAYLDFFTDQHAVARGIAERYRDHPVERWRALFREVQDQLDEADGKALAAGDSDDRVERQTALAATEPALELAVEGRAVTIRYQNLTRCEVGYYRLDVEFSFSTNPFVQQGTGAFAWIQPNRRDPVTLPAGRKEITFDLPAELRSANVLVEVSGSGITRRKTSLASSLAVQTIESYGQLQVTEAQSQKPVPKVYVKVYARMPGGAVLFHKDGYTDLRGRFDYASVSETGTQGAERFAILVLSENEGAVMREVAPPGE